ncbi:DNA helicase [Tanacetum coccineum]
MCLNNDNLTEIENHRRAMFAQWLLDVGNGQIGIPDDSDPDNTSWVDIPDEYYKQGTPIQANMDAKDTEYFDQLLELGSAYRITGFSCEHTGPWERTLENPTSLAFGKFISVQEIPNGNFPEHYFNFASYNELPARLHIKNLVLTESTFYSGNIIRLTLWHEMALNFNVREYEAVEKPVIIAVSSCWVKQFNGLQLSGTSATHYYLNPNIPETYHIKQQAIIGDGSGTISFACFSKQANCLVKDINELLAECLDRNPYHLPPALKELEGTTYIFQFHFDVNSTSSRKVFVLDTVFKETVLPLPAPPIAPIAPEPVPRQTMFPDPTPTPPTDTIPTLSLSDEAPQELPNLSSTAPQPIPIPMNAPTSPALSTTASNELEVTVAEIQKPTSPKTTPPGNQNLIETSKEPKRKNPPESSTRISLFTGNQQIKPPEGTKKTKHEDNTKPEP